MENLDINNLIQKAEEFVHDGKLDNAAYGKKLLQKIELSNNTFDLSLVAEAKYDKTNPNPKKGGKYVVKVEADNGEVFTTIGYWNGMDWERVQEASEHKSADPTFADYGQEIISWRPINENW